jgi:hypothetical protein
VAPPCVVNARVQARLAAGPVVFAVPSAVRLRFRTAARVRGLDGLDRDRVVRSHERERGLVVKIAVLTAHMLMRAGTLPCGLRTARAPLLPSADALLRLLQLTLGLR